MTERLPFVELYKDVESTDALLSSKVDLGLPQAHIAMPMFNGCMIKFDPYFVFTIPLTVFNQIVAQTSRCVSNINIIIFSDFIIN